MIILDKSTFQTRNLGPEQIDVVGDRYLCELLDHDQFRDLGGPVDIMLVGQTEESQGWRPCKVVRVGDGHRLERDVVMPMKAKVDDIVAIERFSGRYLEFGGKKYVIVNQTALLMIFHPEHA